MGIHKPEMGETMSDSAPTTPEPGETPPVAEVAPIELPADHPLVKTLAAQKELIKELRGKASRLDEIEEANKTELQRAQDRAAAAEMAASEASLKALRAEVSSSKGVPANLLSGSTQEELEAAADALLEFRGHKPTTTSSEPQGNRGEPIGNGTPQLTHDDIKSMTPEQIETARKEGRLDKLMGVS